MGRSQRTATPRGTLLTRSRVVACVMAIALASTLTAGPALADSTVTVNTTADPGATGQCSLRDAIAYADATTAEPGCASGTASGTTTIKLPAGTYALSGSGLDITANTIINGAGASSTTISGSNAVQVINVAANVQTTLNRVTISDGLSGTSQVGCGTLSPHLISCPAEPGLNGGGIANAGTLSIVSSAVTGNHASAGVLPRSAFRLACFAGGDCAGSAGSTAGAGGSGGGVYDAGHLTIDHSTISGNSAGAGGNGSDGTSGTGSDASAGEAGGNGGSGGLGGGVFGDSGSVVTISDSSISGNAAGAGGKAGAGSTATSPAGAGGAAGTAGPGGPGGGLVSLGALSMTGSTISANATGTGGAGATGGGGTGGDAAGVSSVSGSGGVAGGILIVASQTSGLTNDTIASNVASPGGTGGSGAGAPGSGGGIYHVGSLTQLSFVTVANNSAAGNAGGIDNASGAMTEADSVVASNTGSPAQNCTTANITDDGSNLVFGDNSCPGTSGDPKLAALSAANGGPTATMALAPGSAAIDSVPLMACPVMVDQRGVSRPNGPACDAGAYEFAPPTVASTTASSSSPTAGDVTANINPNLSAKDTMVAVNYGTSSSYGAAVAAQDIGAGSKPVSFSAKLSGLAPDTLYHYDIVATNGDGATTSSDETFRTSDAVFVSIGRATPAGPRLKLVVGCNGGTGSSTCSGAITVISRVTKHGKTVGSGHYSVTTGHTATVTLTLNRTGKKLLNQFYRLPATVTIAGPQPATKKVTFSYQVIKTFIQYDASFSNTCCIVDQVNDLIFNGIPKGAKVSEVCRTGGCTPKRTSFAVKGANLSLGRRFAVKLPRHAVVDFEVTVPGEVGSVEEVSNLGAGKPVGRHECLTPGARAPRSCP